ncbi:MAG TPA: glycoside hydrolase family 78 protein [Chitinophagaceae bacterium]|nr:glycoside hydrolase family 78 protein [Chitinophagaceae bacterium]
MRKYSFYFLATQLFCLAAIAQVKVQNLLTENLSDPIGLDIKQPRFSWQLVSDQRNVMQTAYEIKVMSSEKNKDKVWESGKISSEQSVMVTYAGKSLESAQRYYWQVRVWDNNGNLSPWSETAFFQTGFFNTSDWKAIWIGPGYTEDPVLRQSPLFRKQFAIKKKIKSAFAYITAHGLYEAQINGHRVGDAYLAPGWTSYNKRLEYQVYDVTGSLNAGKNVIGVTLGSGWYRGHLAWGENKNIYGKDISLLLQLEITYTDGKKETIISDGNWRSTTGSIINSEIYDGEIIDDRAEKNGWLSADYDDSKWSGVTVENFSYDNLLATYNEPIRKHETFKPIKVITTPKGEKVIDFGQNLVGWEILNVKGKAGDTITIQHAEVLDKNGNFYTDNLRAAKATSKYILNGNGKESFEPHFTYYGFRYIKVEGIQGDLNPDDFTAVSLYADMKKTGDFSTSNSFINQLQHNIQWGQKGNFLDVPTDCPQRDERLGWTGDAEVFSRTAAFNMGVNNFFSKWLKDVAADQYTDGSVPHVIPNVLGPNSGGSAGWADVSTIIPWNMYLAYGDTQILKNQYSSMKAWVEYMHSKSKNDLWNTGSHFGDWLFYRPDDDNSGRAAVTDKYLIAQCFYAHSTQLLIDAAKVLGKPDDVAHYSDLLKRIKDAFMNEYVTPNGRLVSSTQTAYVLALNFDMLPESLRQQAAERLVENIKSYNNHLTTGFLGTPYLCHVLNRFGYIDIAYQLLMQDTYPSWLYPVKMGATTIWERWDGEKPDGSFENPGMNSFNHYAYGAIGDFMYRVVTGIDTYEDAPGYKHISIHPHIGGGLTYANADLQTYYGKISSRWKTDNGKIVLDVEIPANTSADVVLPVPDVSNITESGIALNSLKDIKILGQQNRNVTIHIGSGSYHFVCSK